MSDSYHCLMSEDYINEAKITLQKALDEIIISSDYYYFLDKKAIQRRKISAELMGYIQLLDLTIKEIQKLDKIQ
jgi:hypothetical protein